VFIKKWWLTWKVILLSRRDRLVIEPIYPFSEDDECNRFSYGPC
jgi:hypothetical protein